MFKVRTEPVKYGTQPYLWNVDSVYQCTWYAYYRALECGFSAPCYWDRPTRQGSYTNAKEWLANFREPWEVKDVDYRPVAGDIAIFTGSFGHAQFLESDVMYSEYSSGNPNSFRNGKFEKKSNLLGFLHYPVNIVQPVERNTSVDQIQTTDTSLRIRNKASLDGDVIGYVQLGYYNVIGVREADGYTWYKLGKDMYCASVSTIYLPAEGTDVIKEIEKYFDAMKEQVNTLTEENQNIKTDMDEINKISKRWQT